MDATNFAANSSAGFENRSRMICAIYLTTTKDTKITKSETRIKGLQRAAERLVHRQAQAVHADEALGVLRVVGGRAVESREVGVVERIGALATDDRRVALVELDPGRAVDVLLRLVDEGPQHLHLGRE